MHPFIEKLMPVGMQLKAYEKREKLRMMKTAEASRERDGQHHGKFYAGAQSGINRPGAPMLSTPEDYKQAAERIVMIRYSRQMEEDIPYIESILGDFETYVVGDLRYRPNTGNKDADKRICEHLEFRFSQCDYAEKNDLTSMAKLAIRSKKRDGECGFAYVDTGDGLKLSAVEADCIGNPFMGSSQGPDNFNGIMIDPESKAVREYNLWRRLPKLNAYVFDKTVGANLFIHFADQFRFSQYHGVTAFKNGISRATDIEQAIQFAIQNIKFRSSQLPAIQNEQGRPRGNGYEAQPNNAQGVAVPLQIDIDGVQQNFLKLGEGFVEYPHDFPNANFRDITSDLKGDVALGVHLPAEFCFRSEAGGVLQRFYIEKAQRTFDEEKRLLRIKLLNPYKNRVLRKDVDSGTLNLDDFPGLSDSMDLYKGTWHMGRSVTTDYGHDTDSDIKLIDANMMSPEEYAADNARDLEEIFASKESNAKRVILMAQRVAKETGVDFQIALPFCQKQFPNPQVQTTGTGDAEPQGESSIDEAKAIAEAYGVGVRAGTITPSIEDEDFMRKKLGLPPLSSEARKDWGIDPIRRPITLAGGDAGEAPTTEAAGQV